MIQLDDIKRLVRVRSFLSLADAHNKWILQDADVVVNVSANHDSDVASYLRSVGAEYYWFPMSERVGTMGLQSFYGALTVLKEAVENHRRVIIHCFAGNNRSKSVYECLCFMMTGEWPKEDYKDSSFVVEYNCKHGYLPALDKMEDFITEIKDGKSLEDLLYDVAG